MNLCSPEAICFSLFILILYYIIRPGAQKYLLLMASSIFIYTFSLPFLAYTLLFVLMNYSIIRLLDNKKTKTSRKLICNTGITLNILSLVFFKYINFIIENIALVLHLFNHSLVFNNLNLIVPIGISYYTFQGISYTLQIYRGHEKIEKDIVVFSNYFLFFPKFIAGPIELSKNFIPQLKEKYQLNYSNLQEGFQLVLWGAFKKMVIADRLSLLIHGVYSNVNNFSSQTLLITFFLQPLHLYCDFSGYTDIALGIGRLFGFKLTNNFNRPFFSTSVTMFWRRWHISLSTWCNEFIFKRLSFKKRKWGNWASVYAVFVTFLIIGIWHGTGWNFIILGLLQGIAINYEFFTKKTRLKIAAELPPKFVLVVSCLITYLFFCFTITFFNSTTLPDTITFISSLFTNTNLTDNSTNLLTTIDKTVLFISVGFLAITEFRQEIGKNIFAEVYSWPTWIRWTIYYAIIALIFLFGSPQQEFVYMKF
jgi:alginate O-acetyltransferase complex protein AlgI